MNKPMILDLIRLERERFDHVVRQISEMHLAEAPIMDGWTAKDVIAHVTAWERRTITWLATAARGEPERLLDTEAIDRLNSQTLMENKNRPLGDVIADSHSTFQQLVASVQALPDDPNDVGRSVWRGGESPWELIASNTYEHYRTHLESIMAWLEQLCHCSEALGDTT